MNSVGVSARTSPRQSVAIQANTCIAAGIATARLAAETSSATAGRGRR